MLMWKNRCIPSKLLIKTLETNINELKKLSSTVINLNKKYNHIEQYSRRENIRIHSYPETKEDVLGIVMGLANDMQININEYDTSVCHRTGKSKDGKPRQLIVKFCSRYARDLFLSGNSQLYDDVFLTKDLTTQNLKLLMESKKYLGPRHIIVHNGKFYKRTLGGQTNIHIKSLLHLQSFSKPLTNGSGAVLVIGELLQ
ncbi:unnamed protein product [Didymodactylos carnosus]|uniref:Uncharacterized protein n=1 Tax=Didymodactylos carnosus TaxID=1234261 RepID=A0A814ZSC8_9BILA|nr:unnamed protein product [Didymodactylos carnosus]CAF4014519.1 unnamed protein product [Didymodactylos carnosus]